jgi:hypothetical protein
MLTYALAGLAGVLVTLGGQGAVKAIRSGSSEPVEYAMALQLTELSEQCHKDREAVRKDIAAWGLQSQEDSKRAMQSFLAELKIESDAREALAHGLTQEREALAAAGGIATRGEISAALEQLHLTHQSQVEGLHRALVSVARRVEILSAPQAQAVRSTPVMPNWPLPAAVPPQAPWPTPEPEVEPLFPEGMATVPLRPVGQPATDPYRAPREPSFDPSELLAGLQALRGMTAVPQ